MLEDSGGRRQEWGLSDVRSRAWYLLRDVLKPYGALSWSEGARDADKKVGPAPGTTIGAEGARGLMQVLLGP